MFHFEHTHVIENPEGHAPGWNYSPVGAVPQALIEPRRPWPTVEALVAAVRGIDGAKLCDMPKCACRKLFG